jgi:hypothetical protein
MTIDEAVARAARQYDDIVQRELVALQAKSVAWRVTPDGIEALVEFRRQQFADTRGRMLQWLRAKLETGHAVQ